MKIRSIKHILQRNTILAFAAIAIVQLLISSWLFNNSVKLFVNETIIQSNYISDSVSATIIFESRENFYEILNELDVGSKFQSIKVTKRDKSVFGEVGVSIEFEKLDFNERNYYITIDGVATKTDIIFNNEYIGTLYIMHGTSALKQSITNILVSFLLASFFQMIILILLIKRLNNRIASPLSGFARIISNLSEIKSDQAIISGEGKTTFKELVKLSKVYNDNLGQIQSKNRELEEVNEKLDAKYQQKTEELVNTLNNLKQFQKKLVAQEKLASLGSLSAGIAHEIKNPLNLINNAAIIIDQFVQSSLPDYLEKIRAKNLDEKSMDFLIEDFNDISETCKIIIRNGQRADNIVKSMLAQSRSGDSDTKIINLTELVQEASNLSFHAMRAKGPINVEPEIHLEKIEKFTGRPQDIERAIVNLLDNAYYALDEKSKASGRDYKAILKIKLTVQENKAQLYIYDNGTGIPSNVIDRIFEPFFTTKPTGKGTGLGMSMVNDIIMSHEGEMKVRSEEGEFTEIIITLPIG